MAAATIDDYLRNPDRALIDALADPILRQFIDQGDIGLVAMDMGGGVQGQVQALSKAAVAKVARKVVARFKQAGADVKNWICDPNEFDLCKKLKTTKTGELMHAFNEFFENKWTERGITAAHAALFIPAFTSAHVLAPFLVTFSALGLLNGAFVDLCECPK